MSDRRLADYYNQSLPPSLYPSTGATAGAPGSFTPAGWALPPDALTVTSGAWTITPSPATNWTVGQYVQTATAGTGGRVYWNGTAWVAGTHP